MKKSYRILIISAVIYIVSLLFPAVKAGTKEVYGLTCFLFGWTEMQGGGIAWLANPVLFIAAFALLLDKVKASAVLSFIAVALTFCFLSVKEVTVDEAGHQYAIVSYGPAYFLWMASCFSLFIGNLFLLMSSRKNQNL
ncbi:MAG: hypothetical protein LBE92_07605 [Chryseobacterium sp.]|jgi:hypothetical protein|uniref:hypothetical protein n=1 Tax=Chryseobacterium sp. TaxID=1871047 RepID=UPI002839B875|nr:hypothetical protein [Chryseobacterium sp.]MDR2235971.1 hypothetical protein [Chryseobacterium sp.]